MWRFLQIADEPEIDRLIKKNPKKPPSKTPNGAQKTPFVRREQDTKALFISIKPVKRI